MEYFWAFVKSSISMISAFVAACLLILLTSFGVPTVTEFFLNYKDVIANVLFLLFLAVIFVSDFLRNLDLERKKKVLEDKNNS